MKNADGCNGLSILCYISKEAMILAPRELESGCQGLVIGLESASRRTITFNMIDCDNNTSYDYIRLRMPEINGKVAVIENCVLDIM